MSSSFPSNVPIQELLQDFQGVIVTRYLSAAGVVILLYDHLLTFAQEVEDIWKAPWTLAKFLFLALRYVVPATMIVQTMELSGISHVHLMTPFCQVWLPLSTTIGIVSIGFSNLLMLLRLWAIWEKNKAFMVWTFTGFVITQLGALACLSVGVSFPFGSIVYDQTMDLCIVTQRKYIWVLWFPGVVFEIMVFIAVFWNAFDRPRSNSITFFKDLQRDGLFYFLLLFFLRLANLTISIFAPLSHLFVGTFFIWCATTLTVTRFILNLRRIASEQRSSRMGIIDGHSEDPISMAMVDVRSTSDDFMDFEKD